MARDRCSRSSGDQIDGQLFVLASPSDALPAPVSAPRANRVHLGEPEGRPYIADGHDRVARALIYLRGPYTANALTSYPPMAASSKFGLHSMQGRYVRAGNPRTHP